MIRTLCALALLAATFSALAQSSATSASAIIPSQFASAKTVFIAGAGVAAMGNEKLDFASTFYTSVARSLAASGLYQLKTRPADAELSMRTSIESKFSEVNSGSSFGAFYVRLDIYDTKTGMLLWVIEEPIQGVDRTSTALKNIDSTVSKLTTDLQSLANGKLP